MNSLGLYIHMPFCRSKCRYCDFYSLTSVKKADAYVDATVREIGRFSTDAVIDSVFFGGGTPTVLSVSQLETLCRRIRESFSLSADCEWTVEANPATVDRDELLMLRDMGVNRLSFGLQSIYENELKCLGRIHDRKQFDDDIALARECGFQNISADLMLGIPYQTKASLSDSIRHLSSLSLTHISVYGLRIEEGTAFGRMKDKLPLPSEEEEAEMYLMAVSLLNELGYRQYEISNFAKDGYASRHNLKYWRREPYLGIGPGAHSFMDGKRFFYERDLARYCDQPSDCIVREAPLSESDIRTEEIMLALRMPEGVPMELLPYDRLLHQLGIWEREGLCVRNDKKLRLTPKGMWVSNGIISEILLEADES